MSSRSRLIGPATFETIPEEDESALEDSLAGANVKEDNSESREGENDGNGDKSALDVEKTRIEEDSSERREEENDGNGDKPALEDSLVARTIIEEDSSERREGRNGGNDDEGTVVAEVEEATGSVEKQEDHGRAITEESVEKEDVVDITCS